MRLAGVVITFNEELNLERCLKSLSFCDEIVVVDSGSSDRTVEIAQKYASKVIFHDWSGYASQKNFANSLTDCEWILSLDADEEVSKELCNEIKSLKNAGFRGVGYSIPRKNIHFKRWIQYGGWYPNRLVRLFFKESGSWSKTQVHEQWICHGEIGSLNCDLIHHSFKDLEDQVEKSNRYSTLAAGQLFMNGQHFCFLNSLVKPIVKFFETYLIKLGFLDGFPGFINSMVASYAVFLKCAKLWEMERGSSKK